MRNAILGLLLIVMGLHAPAVITANPPAVSVLADGGDYDTGGG